MIYYSLTTMSTMISVTVDSSEFQSLILNTVAFGLCFGRLGWLAKAPMSIHHPIHTTPSWIANVPVMIECIWKSHIGETGHVWASLHWPRIHFQEWHDADTGMCCFLHHLLWVLWVLWVLEGLASRLSPLNFTLHDQRRIILNKCKCVFSHLNGGQLRQVYSITETIHNHSQTQHNNTHRRWTRQTQRIWVKANLVIILSFLAHSPTVMMRHRTRCHQIEWIPTLRNLVNRSHKKKQLLNAALSQLWKDSSPKRSDFSFGKSSHQSIQQLNTIQLYGFCVIECVTTRLNGLQRRQV